MKFLALAALLVTAAEETVPVETMLAAAENNIKINKLDRAKLMLDQAKKSYPDDGRVDYFYGLVFAQQEKPEDAVKAFEAAVKKRPDMIEAHLNLALQLDVLKRYDASDKVYADATKRFPKDVDLLTEWGTTLILRDKLKEAEDVLKRAAALDPKNGQTQCDLAYVESKLKRAEQAIKRYEAALKSFDDPGCKRQLGDTYAAVGDLAHAEAVYTALLAKDSNDGALYYRRSKVREAKGDKAGAAADKAEWEKRKKK
ncbi:MAG: tetratricopeptide repeat protein [Deltaproteobacteria bacterium]|nr:tetratricopeptide repeat protein [Deltaproteobacteria bacterium]